MDHIVDIMNELGRGAEEVLVEAEFAAKLKRPAVTY